MITIKKNRQLKMSALSELKSEVFYVLSESLCDWSDFPLKHR
jgi:hypothetical protein